MIINLFEKTLIEKKINDWIKKWAKNINGQFSKEEIQMVKGYITWKMQINISM
jgi:hypothetical protein